MRAPMSWKWFLRIALLVLVSCGPSDTSKDRADKIAPRRGSYKSRLTTSGHNGRWAYVHLRIENTGEVPVSPLPDECHALFFGDWEPRMKWTLPRSVAPGEEGIAAGVSETSRQEFREALVGGGPETEAIAGCERRKK